MSVTLHMLSGQTVVFESNYAPGSDENNQSFVFDAPLLNTLYEVAVTPSFIMGGYDVVNKTVNGFKLIWNNGAPTAAPPAPSLVNAASGLVEFGTHSWFVTWISLNTTEGPQGAVASLFAADRVSPHGSQFTVGAPIDPGLSTAKRKIYRNKIATPTSFFLLTTINDNTTPTFTDNVADASLGGAAPAFVVTPNIFLRVKR